MGCKITMGSSYDSYSFFGRNIASEFLVVNLTVTISVYLGQHLINSIVVGALTHLCHGLLNLVFTEETILVQIERLENFHELVYVIIFVEWDRDCLNKGCFVNAVVLSTVKRGFESRQVFIADVEATVVFDPVGEVIGRDVA